MDQIRLPISLQLVQLYLVQLASYLKLKNIVTLKSIMLLIYPFL